MDETEDGHDGCDPPQCVANDFITDKLSQSLHFCRVGFCLGQRAPPPRFSTPLAHCGFQALDKFGFAVAQFPGLGCESLFFRDVISHLLVRTEQ